MLQLNFKWMIGPLSFDKTQTGEKLKPVRLIELRSRGRSGRCGRANLLKGNRISADLDWIDATLLENRIASIRQSVSSLRPRPATHNGDESLQHGAGRRREPLAISVVWADRGKSNDLGADGIMSRDTFDLLN